MAPFAGEVALEDQAREFPRVFVAGESRAEARIPENVEAWVSLRAYQLSSDEEPAVKSEGAGRVSVTYLHGKFSQTEKRMAGLLDGYLLHAGSRA